jgi:hypothetical protein
MVGCDIAARVGVVVLLAVVMGRLLDQSDGSDGLPAVAAVPLAGYGVWNLATIVWAGRRVRQERRGAEARRFSWLLGAGAVVRALWLLPVARDPFWRSTALSALLVATLLTIAAATIVVSSADEAR